MKKKAKFNYQKYQQKKSNPTFLILAYISSLIIGILLASLFIASWAMAPPQTTQFTIITIFLLALSLLTYLTFKQFKIQAKTILLLTISLSLIISLAAYQTKTFMIKYITTQAAAIAQIPDPNLAQTAANAVNQLLTTFNTNSNLLIFIAIILITYNILPVVFLLRKK